MCNACGALRPCGGAIDSELRPKLGLEDKPLLDCRKCHGKTQHGFVSNSLVDVHSERDLATQRITSIHFEIVPQTFSKKSLTTEITAA